MTGIIEYFKSHLMIILIIGGLLLIVLYTMFAVFLNKLSNMKRGKTTPLVWLPVINIYLLGKLVINSIIGLLLVILLLYGIIISVDIPGLEVLKSLKLSSTYVLPYQIGYFIMILSLVIIGKSKLNQIIRDGRGKDDMSTFIAKDYDDKEPVIKEEIAPKKIEEWIQDEYQYTHTSLSDLSKLNNNSDNNSNDNP